MNNLAKELDGQGIASITIGVVALVAFIVILTIVLVRYFKKRKIKESDEKVKTEVKDKASSLASKLGDNSNIEKIENNGSRVTVYIKDMDKVDKDAINSVIDNVMYMNNKIIFLIGSHSEEFKTLLEENIDKTIKGEENK